MVKFRSDREIKFENVDVDLFCKSNGIKHEFLAPKTLQQNEVVERKNKVLQEMTRVKIHIHNTPKKNMGICGPAFFTSAPTQSVRLTFYL